MTAPSRSQDRRKRGCGIGEAALVLGVPVPTLRDWMNAGKVPGVHRTDKGHRWVTRDGLLRFAKARGIERASIERRLAPRVAHKRAGIRVEARFEGNAGPSCGGSGTLWDMSRSGFRIDRLSWESGVGFVRGSAFRFRLTTREGELAGVEGNGSVAWLMDNRASRGATLGAEIHGLEGSQSREAWANYLEGRLDQ